MQGRWEFAIAAIDIVVKCFSCRLLFKCAHIYFIALLIVKSSPLSTVCVRIFHQVAEYVEIAAEVAAAAIPWFQEYVSKCQRNRRLEFLVCRRVIEIKILLKGKVKSYWAENQISPIQMQVNTYLYTLIWNAFEIVGFSTFQKQSSKGKMKLHHYPPAQQQNH